MPPSLSFASFAPQSMMSHSTNTSIPNIGYITSSSAAQGITTYSTNFVLNLDAVITIGDETITAKELVAMVKVMRANFPELSY